MRILVVSNLYPPVVRGGYEVECSGVVDRLRAEHEVTVLASSLDADTAPPDPSVVRTLAFLGHDEKGALGAPVAALRAVRETRRLLAHVRPELVYVWNGSQLPHAALRVILDSGTPTAFRVCEHWFGRLFTGDQFMRELLPAERGAGRRAWALGCQAFNRQPALRLEPLRRAPAAVCWNSDAIRRLGGAPGMLDLRLERRIHSVPRFGELYAAVERSPAPEPLLAYVGRIAEEKGIETALGALAVLRQESSNMRLAVAGPGDPGYVAQLRTTAARLHVADAVDWLGPQTPEQVAGLLARATVLVVPSVWEEPFPLVTIEGAFAGVPLVAADTGGVSEGMAHEEHALLYPPGDVAACAAALTRVVAEPAETAARVIRATERADAFRQRPYEESQAAFVRDAHAALTR